MSDHANSARTLFFGIALGIIGAIVTYGRMPALGFTLFVLLEVDALFLNARLQNIRPLRRNLFIVVPLLFCAVMFAVRSDDTLSLMNLGAGVAAALLLVYFFASGNLAQQDILEYVVKLGVSGIAVLIQPFEELGGSWKWLRHYGGGWRAVLPVARGILITAPVIVVFVILLSSADQVFADGVSKILQSLTFNDPFIIISEGILAGIFGWAAVGGMGFALLDRKLKRAPVQVAADEALSDFAPASTPAKKAPPIFQLGFTEMTILLGSVCAVFSAFVVIQFVYLFGGVRNIDTAGYSYADYVHRGFAELVIVGILTLGLAYVIKAVTVRSKTLQETVFCGLSTLLMALTAVILISAFQRLRLYEDTYGFTTLRLTVYVFIVWLGVLFVGFTLSLYWKPAMINVFGLTTLIAAFGFVMTLDVLNPDAFVAREMVDRNDVDPIYLESLGTEAVPAMVSELNLMQSSQYVSDPQYDGLRSILKNSLSAREGNLASTDENDWRSFSFGHSSALVSVESTKGSLTPNYQYRDTLHKVSDFDFLARGMSFRRVVRQLGQPYSYGPAYDREGYGIDNRNAVGDLSVTYLLDGGDQLNMIVDTSSGLTMACVMDNTFTCKTQLQLK